MIWHIKLSPVFGPDYTLLVTDGASLWIDGDEFDLSSIGAGQQAEVEHNRVLGPIRNVAGVMHVTVRFDSPTTSPEEYNFPDESGYLHEGDGVFWIDGEPPDFLPPVEETP